MKEKTLFEVGQLVETKSFQPGYRGAWFNCKIISVKGDAVSLQYCDFPDEKLHWTKFYQKPHGRKSIKGKKELMLRPCFPPIYRESQLPNASTISGVAVVLKDVWCVGDLVDWRFDDCYWSGRITQVFGNEKYEIELLPHPFGEGAFYEGSSDQLRPSLEWSPHEGWTLSSPPPVLEWSKCRSPARLIYPTKQDGSTMSAHTVDNRINEVEEKTDAVSQPDNLLSSSTSSGSLPTSNGFSQMGKGLFASEETKEAEKAGNIDVKDGVSRPNFFAGISSLQGRNASMKLAQDFFENGRQHDCGPKKSGNGVSIPLNPKSNPAEAATSLPPSGLEKRMSESLNVSSKESKKSESYLNVRGKQPSSTSTPMTVNTSESCGHPDAGPSKKMRTAGNFSLSFTNSSSIEAAILDLEELVNKVKWMKRMLQFGLTNSPPSWKFVEHRESSMRK